MAGILPLTDHFGHCCMLTPNNLAASEQESASFSFGRAWFALLVATLFPWQLPSQ
jgi:hypothetical protein